MDAAQAIVGFFLVPVVVALGVSVLGSVFLSVVDL